MVMAVGMAVIMSVVMIVIMVVVIVVLAHASVPVEGSAICSSISLSTPLIWASAAE
ncbi:putative membrane protein [Duganella sp. SG902]|nr:putative membrane protein [Duganella sp. SG902]